ncbi:sensor histidine kinase [Mediterraneibacter agrestimuris]|uniref:sensor histidine kinase n=1 Tax=Mediterraneibacter agrestimuris TaxID=2941333 RepID=UPI00203B2E76|nr:ATP-binding protein [Mediterraneibacter agrestimuris]
MSILFIIIEILATVVEAYIGIKFVGLLLESKYEESKTNLIAITTSFVLAFFVHILNSIELFSYGTLAFGVVSISLIVFSVYRCKFPHAFLISCFYFMCLNYLDFLAITIVGALLHNPDYSKIVISTHGFVRIRQMFICKGLLILAYLSAKHFMKGKFKINSFKHYVILTIAGGIGVVYLIDNSLDLVDFGNVMNWIVFSVILILTWALLLLYEKSKNDKDMAKFMEIKNALLEENYKGLNDAYSANAKVYHDFNNHINILYQYLIHSDTKSAIEYLDRVSEPIKNLLERTWTGNEVIDVIINSKLRKMKENHIQSSINVEFPGRCDIMPNDICTILSNLLDNAIEACQRNQDNANKWINITIRIINQMLILIIENGNEVAPQVKNKRLVTSKEDERFHGWGLKSVESSIEKYEGVMQYKTENGKFKVVVTLNYNIIEKEDVF